MKRVWLAFFLAPTLVSLPFGLTGLFLLYFLLVVTLIVAVPLFFLFQRLQCLQWWHALLAGLLCALVFIALDASVTHGSLDYLISANNITFLGYGALVSVLFWWIGIFRNPAFPFVSQRVPIGFALVVPLFLAGFTARQMLFETFQQGRVLAISKPATNLDWGKATVQITGGPTLEADFTNTWPERMIVGKCFHLTNHWSTLKMRRVDELMSPFGGDVNDC